MLTQLFFAEWSEARTRFTNLLSQLTENDLTKKNGQSPNSAGFLVRHILEVELLFAKNVFRNPEVQIVAKTVISKKDTGEWTDLISLKELNQYATKSLSDAILKQTEEDWSELISTQEFGTKSKAQALGRIVSHTAYHAGQLALVLKYGH